MASNYILSNSDITLVVSTKGAEIISIKDKYNKEYIWQGCADVWSDHFYNIFPICGRLINDTYSLNGKNFKMSLHGFALNKEFKIESFTNEQITLFINEDQETLKVYPFKFLFKVRITIANNKVIIEYSVTNNDKKTMYYSLGSHPGFVLTIDDETKFEDYYIEISGDTIEKYELNDKKILKNFSAIIKTNIINLNRKMFEASAQIYKVNSEIIKLKCKNKDIVVLSELKEFPYLVLFTAKDAKLICIEPWGSLTMFENENSDITTRNGFINLIQNETRVTKYQLEVCL